MQNTVAHNTDEATVTPDHCSFERLIKNLPSPDIFKLRMAGKKDTRFMQRLFVSTREHWHLLQLPSSHINVLLDQQYQLQQASYAQQWPNAYTFIIENATGAIGKITFDESSVALHIVDFAIESNMRGKGYGTAVLRVIQSAAGERSIGLSVDRQNLLAKKLYLRLGFQVNGVSGAHESMIWRPLTAATNHESIR